MLLGRPMTRTRIPFLVTVLALALAAGCVTTQSAGPSATQAAAKAKGPQESFKFDWPKAEKMKLTIHRTQTTEGNGKSTTWDGTSAMLLTVEHHQDGGLVIHSTDQAFEGSPKAPFSEILARVATTTIPTLVISPAGDLDRVEDEHQILTTYASAGGIDLDKVAKAHPAQVAQIDAAVAKAMHATASDLWNNMVAFWAGRTAPVGKKITKKNMVPIPALGGSRVTMNLDYQVMGKVPCVAGETARNCVQVELDSHPDATEVHKLLDAQLKQEEAKAAAAAKAQAAAEAKAEAEAKAQAAGTATTGTPEGTPKAPEAAAKPAEAPKAAAGEAKTAAPAAGEARAAGSGAAAAPAKPLLTKPVMTGLSNTVHIVLVTDPQTLLPYILVKTRETEVTTRMPDGTDQVQKQHEKITYTFTYGAGAVAPTPMVAPAPAAPADATKPAGDAAKPADGAAGPTGDAKAPSGAKAPAKTGASKS
jgi:hypothetical protein